MAKILDSLRANAKAVQRLEGATANEFLRLLKELERSLTGRLSAAYAGDRPLQADMLGRVLASAKAEIQVLENRAAGVYQGMTEDAVDLSIRATVDELTRLSSGLDGVALDVSLDAAKGLADPAQALLANHFDTSVEKYGLDMLNQVRQKLFVGLRSGTPYGDIVKQVGSVSQQTKAGAERLVRTEVSHAYGAAKHQSITQAGEKIPGLKKMWLHESTYDCDICKPLDHTERDLKGTWTFKHGKQTRTVSHPPAHPHCTCILVSVKPKWSAALAKLGYLDPLKKAK